MLQDSLHSRLGRPFTVYSVNWPRLTVYHFDFYSFSRGNHKALTASVPNKSFHSKLASPAQDMDSSLHEQ